MAHAPTLRQAQGDNAQQPIYKTTYSYLSWQLSTSLETFLSKKQEECASIFTNWQLALISLSR
jgi:hypothetical protein